MSRYFYRVFTSLRTIVDGADYHSCCFRNCTLIYEGGEPPLFDDCTLVDCKWLLGRLSVSAVGFMVMTNVSESSQLLEQLVQAQQRSSAAANGDALGFAAA